MPLVSGSGRRARIRRRTRLQPRFCPSRLRPAIDRQDRTNGIPAPLRRSPADPERGSGPDCRSGQQRRQSPLGGQKPSGRSLRAPTLRLGGRFRFPVRSASAHRLNVILCGGRSANARFSGRIAREARGAGRRGPFGDIQGPFGARSGACSGRHLRVAPPPRVGGSLSVLSVGAPSGAEPLRGFTESLRGYSKRKAHRGPCARRVARLLTGDQDG